MAIILNKYLAAALHVLAIAAAALLRTLGGGPLTVAASDQIVILVIGAVVIYWVPLLNTKWAGLLKVIAAALTAAATALYPILTTGNPLTPADWLTVGLAILGALGVAGGVSARLDSIRLNGLNKSTAVTLGSFHG